jgi:hypothetical protein
MWSNHCQGLLAWLYEKLITWTDAYPWSDTELLTWVSIYLFSRAGPTASLRIYFEAGNEGFENLIHPYNKSDIPLGISYFPKELDIFPRR